ncbi:MAG: hypothetical protein RSA64_02245 [Christensenellaceae bacterium]
MMMACFAGCVPQAKETAEIVSQTSVPQAKDAIEGTDWKAVAMIDAKGQRIEGQAVSDYLGGDMSLHCDKENAITRDISGVRTAGTYALEDAANVSITLDDEKYLAEIDKDMMSLFEGKGAIILQKQ